MFLPNLGSAALHLRPLTAAARGGRHSCVRLLSTAPDSAPGGSSIALPKFLVTTVKPQSQDGDNVVFDRYSKQVSDLPVFLVNVKYEDKASVASKPFIDGKVDKETENSGTEIKKFADEGKGEFSGTLVSQAQALALAL